MSLRRKLKLILKEIKQIVLVLATLGLCLCLSSALCGIPAVEAATVWSDNFNDGDTAGWTTHTGGFTASNNYLQGSTSGTNHISHPSTVARGTWSFDLHINPLDDAENTAVFFMASDLNAGNNDFPSNGYSIEMGYGWIGLAEAFGLVRYENDVRNSMDIYVPSSSQEDFHFDITRGDDDHIYVFIDGTAVMDRQNSAHDTSAHFFIQSTGTERWVDNIVVSNTVDYTTTPTTTNGTNGTTPGIPGFPALAITLGLVTALTIGITVRRRKQIP